MKKRLLNKHEKKNKKGKKKKNQTYIHIKKGNKHRWKSNINRKLNKTNSR